MSLKAWYSQHLTITIILTISTTSYYDLQTIGSLYSINLFQMHYVFEYDLVFISYIIYMIHDTWYMIYFAWLMMQPLNLFPISLKGNRSTFTTSTMLCFLLNSIITINSMSTFHKILTTLWLWLWLWLYTLSMDGKFP